MNESKLSLSNRSLFSIMANTEPEEVLNVEEVSAPFPLKEGDTGTAIKALQHGLNQYEGVNIKEDGIFGPLTTAAVKTAGFTSPVSQADFTEITSSVADAPLADSSSKPSSQPSSSKDKSSPPNQSINWIPFGVNFKKNTTTQKALVWGVWLILAALLIWGGIVLFGEEKGKKK